ncbi:DUF5358 family protein [Mannheimia indoligenes]|uniref:DUF5358 family protein n=1 Tax=Mannheimia indoligenes TaxID=3103145 RepID=UPI002FE525BA
MKLKYQLLVASLAFLTACGSNTYIQSYAYKISDKDMKQVILEHNNIEQCIYPKLKGLSYEEATSQVYNKMSEAEHLVMNDYFYPKSIAKVIGIENTEKLLNDYYSREYAATQQAKFNNQIANINPEECKSIKAEFNLRLKEAKQFLINKKKEELAKAKKQKIAAEKAEKARKAREAYLKTPAGQAELAKAEAQRAREEQQKYQLEMLKLQQQILQATKQNIPAQNTLPNFRVPVYQKPTMCHKVGMMVQCF